MRYLLDTNAVIALVNDRDSRTSKRIRAVKPADVGISAIVAHELYFGAFKSRRRNENVALVDELQLEVVEFDKEDARAAGEIRALLAAVGTPIGPYDVLIAGQAKSRGLTLVSSNQHEFARVEGLAIENWEN
jgi:tRNA(fMet)-specific endonuclease VapC